MSQPSPPAAYLGMGTCPIGHRWGYTIALFALRLLVALRLSVFSMAGRPSRILESLVTFKIIITQAFFGLLGALGALPCRLNPVLTIKINCRWLDINKVAYLILFV